MAPARQHPGVGVQHDVVGLIRNGIEHAVLGFRGLFEHAQRLVAVRCEHDRVKPLGFVPDSLIAEGPDEVERVKRGLLAAYRRLCELEWDTLLLAHGLPLVGDGKEKLRGFAGS